MEKNKGLFSFREHPVGNFSDRKKGRKRKGGRLRRSMGFLMAAALIFNTLPANGLTVSASGREAGLCKHHQEHDADCGYIPKSEDGEGSLCTYECRICPIEDLIAALPDKGTKRNEFRLDHAEEVRAQLEEILALYRELNEDEQEQIDLSRCYELQEELDNANAPMTADGRTEQQDTDGASVTINGETLYYATLEEAFAAANRQTATITMLTDAECVHSGSNGSPLNINNGTVTLDLNGKTLSGKGYGDYGIIDVSGGSLLVEGEGNISLPNRAIGLSCYSGGTLTVAAVNIVLGSDSSTANAGVYNVGGTVVLNGTQMTGAAFDAQIYHYSGTTTINNVTATGATEDCPKSVCYCNEGTLTINGGTFDKIVVESGNYGGAQSVVELLGGGYTYKKQDGTWATADDLAAMEISNVTVKKIPLTIHPQGDTSWYYGSPHTLAMNAAPVNGSDSITYVWKNGNETLGCTSDACTVPADTPVGSYTYTCEATCDGYTLSHTFTFKIEKSGIEFTGDVKTYNGDTQTTTFNADDTITVKATPTATGTAPAKAAARLRGGYTAPTAGQMALFVGDVQVSEPVEAGADGTYTMTVSAADVLLAAGGPGTEIPLTARFTANNNMADGAGTVTVNITAVAVAEKDGKVIGYYGESGLDAAFANSGNAGATFTLLANVERPSTLSISINCTLDLNGKTIRSTGEYAPALDISSGATVTIRGEGEIIPKQSHALVVLGSVTLEGGTFTSNGENFAGVYVNGGTLSITGEKVVIQNTSNGGYGLAVNSVQSVQLSAGTYKGEKAVSIVSGTITLGDLLAEGHAYHSGNTPIPLQPDGKELTGIVTVKECNHTGEGVCTYAHIENTSTHIKTCLACGETWAEENCIYGEYTHNDTSHTRICKLCGYQDVKEHNIKCTAEASGTVIEVSEACKTCGYGKDLGTVTIHIPKLVYGDLTGVVTAENTLTEPVSVAGNVKNPLGETVIFSDHAIIAPPTMATLTGNALLSAGEHKIKINIVIIRDENALAECELTFNVDPAPLTADMVTLSAESTTYSGTEQKPALSVKQGETTLTEGTDYEVSYTRDGVVTNDFTSAGTVKITVTGKGNYGGKVEKAFTIKQAEFDVGTVTAETLENTLDVSQVVLSRTNQTPAGTLTLTDSTLKYGTNTYTWKFTPDNTNYKTVTGEVEVTVNDTAPPTGEISIGTNKWNSFLNKITFGLFFKKTEQVMITAQDNESGVASVSYYISDSGLTEEEVKKLDNWTAGNTDKTTISISQKEACVVYAKITDNQGNMTYISSDGLQFDGTLPSITGVTDGETYCTPQTVTVTDDNLETVTVNGKEQILSDGKFTLDVKFDTAAIIIAAEDKAGNVTKVTVNAGHDYGTEWKSDSDGHWHECTVCGDKSKVSAHTEDSGTVTKPATQTETGIRTYKCSVCGYKMRTEEIGKLPPVPTGTPLPLPTVTPLPKPTETPLPLPTRTPQPTEVPQPTGTPLPKPTETPLPLPTGTPLPSETPLPLPTVTTLPTVTPLPQPTVTLLPVPTVTPLPTGTPVQAEAPTPLPTEVPLPLPTETPVQTGAPLPLPSETPAQTEKPLPTGEPAATPTVTPLPLPTETPAQTEKPLPTGEPAATPTGTPLPTETPVQTEAPTPLPTEMPVQTVTPLPTGTPVQTEEVGDMSVKLDSGISIKWKGNAIALKWKKAEGADGYDVFATRSGKKLDGKSLVKTVENGKTSVSLTKIDGKKLSGKKVYSVRIKAWKYVEGKKTYTGESRTYHIAGRDNKKYTNAKKLKPGKKKYTLKKGRSARIQVTVSKEAAKKKLLPKSYGPALRYWSGNEKIATVTQGGRVKAKKKGTCYIYATALNGVRTRIKITVK